MAQPIEVIRLQEMNDRQGEDITRDIPPPVADQVLDDISRVARTLSSIMGQYTATKIEIVGNKVYVDLADHSVYIFQNGEFIGKQTM